jgi:hypothetical protein
MASFSSNTFEDQLTDGLILSRSIVFSSTPTHKMFALPEFRAVSHALHVINYSQLYKDFVTDNPKSMSDYASMLTPPSKIRTGDVVQNGDYRGVGSYYAIWLHADVFQNPSSCCLARAMPLARQQVRGRGLPPPPANEPETPPLDLDQYNLDPETWTRIQGILSTNSFMDEQKATKAFLQDKSPDLLEKLTDEATKFRYWEIIRSMRFQGDPGSSVGNDVDWDSLPGEQLLQDEQTPSASQYFVNVPPIAFPILKKPSELSSAMNSHPFMQLYLFEHLDEYGYSAPPAVSMAPMDYFCDSEFNYRQIDLALLPPPLDTQTTFGYVLNNIQNHYPEGFLGSGDDDDEDDDNEEEEEELEEKVETDQTKDESLSEHKNNNKRNLEGNTASKLPASKKISTEPEAKKKKYDLAMLNLGEDALFWFTVNTSSGFLEYNPEFENPVLITRRMFRKHAEEIRKKLLTLRPGATDPVNDEEMNALFHQLLWA